MSFLHLDDKTRINDILYLSPDSFFNFFFIYFMSGYEVMCHHWQWSAGEGQGPKSESACPEKSSPVGTWAVHTARM